VKLGLGSADEVSNAIRQMVTDVADAEDGHPVDRVLVEKMVADARHEMIIGIKRHPSLGLAMLIGRGGSNVEETAEFETVLLPLVAPDLDRAIRKLGLANEANGPGAAFKQACEAVAGYAEANQDRLVTLDVNPVMITANGDAVAADALIVIGKEGT